MPEKPEYESQVTPVDAVSDFMRKADLRKSLTKAQVQLRTSKYFQRIVAAVVIFAVFVDILGTVVVAPALASLCAYAEGGIVDNIMLVSEEEAQYMGFPDQATFRAATMEESISPHAFKGEKGAWAGAPPVKFSLSMNLVLSAGQFGSAGGSMLFGRLCDKIGAKIPMLVCLIMGIIGYIIIYAAGIWVHSYYLFAIGMFWNNFLATLPGLRAPTLGSSSMARSVICMLASRWAC
jgi:MFS family permease